MNPAVRIRDLRYRYRGTDRDVLRMGALDVEGPGLVAVVGKTGVGKTTLMELLAGTLREPYHGSIQVLGVELRGLRRDADRQRHLRRVGLVPQDFGLLPGSTVRDILLQDLADAQVPVIEHEARVGQALDRVGLLPFAGRGSEQLSGGQRQRVAIARTLARDVDLMIADEPTANLDPAQAESIMALFEELGASCPVIIVTHDMGVAARCARTIVLRPLVEHGEPAGAARAHAVEAAVPRRHGVGASRGMLVLAIATAACTLAVRVTNAHHTSPSHVVAEVPTAGVPASTAPRPVAQLTVGDNPPPSPPPGGAAPLPSQYSVASMRRPPETGVLGPVSRGAVAPQPSRSPLEPWLVVPLGGLVGGLLGGLGYLLGSRPDRRRRTAGGSQAASAGGRPDLILVTRHGAPVATGQNPVAPPVSSPLSWPRLDSGQVDREAVAQLAGCGSPERRDVA
jgi:ABC-type lipoprotein export system ATPase subunit